MKKEVKKVRPMLMEMNIGDTLKFPLAKLKSIRTQCYELSTLYDRVYTTHMLKEEKLMSVTRTS